MAWSLSMENQIQTQTPSTKFCLLVCLFGSYIRSRSIGWLVGWFAPHESALAVEMDACIVCCMLVSFFALRTAKPLNDELCCFGSMLKQLNHVYYKFKVHTNDATLVIIALHGIALKLNLDECAVWLVDWVGCIQMYGANIRVKCIW